MVMVWLPGKVNRQDFQENLYFKYFDLFIYMYMLLYVSKNHLLTHV